MSMWVAKMDDNNFNTVLNEMVFDLEEEVEHYRAVKAGVYVNYALGQIKILKEFKNRLILKER